MSITEDVLEGVRLFQRDPRGILVCLNLEMSGLNHPELAKSIAPNGGTGSNIIVVRLQPLDNSIQPTVDLETLEPHIIDYS